MRILKKVIRKLYHLIWFLSVCLIFTPSVFASGAGIVRTDGASYQVAPFADFADNTNGQLTRTNAVFVENGHYFRSSDSLLTNGANTWGVNLLFDSNTSFVAGYTYLVSILVSMNNTYAKPSSTRVCIAETLTNVTTRYNNPSSFPCVNAIVTSTNGTAAFSDGNVTLYYAVLNYIFTSDVTGNSITMTYNTVNSIESNHTFGGYSVTLLSDNRQLTQQQIQSAVQSSGLATANSVQQVQQSINQIQTDINSSANNIINNNNQNTQDIINSSGSNTQSIIDSSASNTQSQIESQKVCSTRSKQFIYDINEKYLTNGGTATNYSLSISNYLEIGQNKSYTINQNRNINGSYLCLYKEDKSLSRCIAWNTSQSRSFTSSSNEYFVRTTISNSGTATLTGYVCENGNQAIDDSLNNIDDTLNDSSIDSSDDTINNLKSKIPTNSVISDLLLLPVRFLQNFVNALGSSCSQFSLGSLYGTELFMPCINIENYLGSGIWTAIDLIISGMFVYALRKKFIEIYENMTNLRNGGNEVD